MADNTTKQANALVSLYLKLYGEKYGRLPAINRYKEKWAMADVIESVGYERARELIEYYFCTSKSGHPLQWFLYNFDQIHQYLIDKAEDERKRAEIKLKTKAAIEEWERLHSES